MNTKIQLVLSILMVLFLAACGRQANTDRVSPTTGVAATSTVAAPQPPVEQPTLTPQATAPSVVGADAVRIEFLPETPATWHTSGDLDAGAVRRFVVAGLAGQQLTIWLSTEPAADSANLYAGLNIIGADGQAFSFSPEPYWSAVLPTTQDYLIEVRSLAQQYIVYQMVLQRSLTTIDPARGAMYDLIPEALCQELRAVASAALGVEFLAQTRAPFFDALGGEAGQGCRLGAGGNGTQFNSPQDVLAILTGSVGAGWMEQPAYQADGPTGAATALARDMALMLISVNWQPAMGVQCPTDRPISECSLKPEEKIYQIDIDIAIYKADFSLAGHWEDAATNFNLDLNQEWKIVYGRHTMVAQGGNKIDALETSLNGMLQGKVATVQFQSSFTTDIGTAQITYLDANTIQWKIIDPPEGEFYLPLEATLTRK